MARLIPNNNTFVGFTTTNIPNVAAPAAATVSAASNITPFVISLNAGAQGNVVPTPAFDTLYETSIIGTSQAQFTMDCYRDNTADTAWTTLTRGTNGFFIISRYGGTGTNNRPIAGQSCEIWPVTITSRSMANMANNAVMTFTVTCAVTAAPGESAVVA